MLGMSKIVPAISDDFSRCSEDFDPDVLTIMTTLELLRSYINRGYYVAARRYEISHEC